MQNNRKKSQKKITVTPRVLALTFIAGGATFAYLSRSKGITLPANIPGLADDRELFIATKEQIQMLKNNGGQIFYETNFGDFALTHLPKK